MCRTLRYGCFALIFLSLALQAWIAFGHFYRKPFQDQFVRWFDGVNWNQVNENYPASRNPERDRFSRDLYENIRSVQDAVDYINRVLEPESENEKLEAAFNLVSERFIHYMYPHHTWVTNPIYAALELLDKNNSFNGMATADELLRHSAAGACGDTSVTFIEIYRALGGEAQYVQLDGHHFAEAKAGGQKWLVDADKDAFASYSIDDIADNPGIVDAVYVKRPPRDRKKLKKMFSGKIVYTGYDGVPYYGAKMYYLHKVVEVGKWFIAPIGIMTALLGLLLYRRRCEPGRV